MPCNDVTEVIRVEFDAHDRLTDYVYNKRTCGQGVGAGNLLIELLRGKTVEWLRDVDVVELLSDYPIDHELEEFLNFKHMFALQGVAEVLTGKEPGGPKDSCAAADISFDPETGATIVHATIPVDLMTEKIRSCGGCKGCGKQKKMVFV